MHVILNILITDKGLKKWKGVALSPDNERKNLVPQKSLPVEPAVQPKAIEIDTVQKENVKPEPILDNTSNEPTVSTLFLVNKNCVWYYNRIIKYKHNMPFA